MTRAINKTLKVISDFKRLERLQKERKTNKVVDNHFKSLSLMDLVPALNAGFTRPEHLKPMIEALEQIWVKPSRFTIACSVQVGKTTTLSAFIIATLLRDPRKRIVYVTYSHTQASLVGREIRELAYRAGLNMSTDVDSKNEFKLLEGGGVFCTSIEGSLTGRALDIIIVDDPVKNRGQARSQAWGQTVDDFYRDVLSTRARSTVSVIIQMARWQRNDLIGKIMDGTLGGQEAASYQYEHIHLPAIKDDGTPLWPEQWTLEKLQGLMTDVITWNSLFQCRPLQDGAEIFSNNISYYKPEEQPLYDIVKAIGVDLAYTATKTADSSVAICVARQGYGEAAKYYILDMIAMQQSAPIFADKLRTFQNKHMASMTRIDAGGTEKGAISFMTNSPPHGLGINLNVVNATQDKVSRSLRLSKLWNENRVFVPYGASWANQLTEQLIGFTGGGIDHDDIVDALSSAINALLDSDFQGSGIISSATSTRSNSGRGFVSRPKTGRWQIGGV